MRKFFLAVFASLAAVACAPLAEPSNGVSNCGLAAGTVVDEKVLYGAEVAYNIPAHAYVTLDGSGQLTPAIKASVKPKLIGAYNALVLARSAYKIGSTCDFYTAVSNVTKLANEARNLLPKP